MCGIAGFLSYRFLSNTTNVNLASMVSVLFSRGPDDTGHWFDEQFGIGLAHTRLAVVDLSPAGHQPMPSACERYVIAFNGEIYNHNQLRKQLEQENNAPIWRGHSDTETLLACFSAWGVEKTLKATVGMFAIALWDRQKKSLTLARDRVGEKPLYWGWQDDTLLFASELKALKAHPVFKAEVCRDALAMFMRYNYIPAPHSIYKGIYKLLPGHFITLNSESKHLNVRSQSYWSMKSAIENGISHPFNGTNLEAVDLLEHRLSQSISDQMLADVPLGAFLSGGVDSTVVVALMQKQASQPVKTYAIGFDDPRYNEAKHAAAVARHLKTEHTELYVSSKDALDLVPRLPSIYCEPFADSSQLPTFLVSKMARQHVTVALSGDGGDELFGGYTPYLFAPKYWQQIQKWPLAFRKYLSSCMSKMPLPNKFLKLASVMGARTKEEFYLLLVSHWLQTSSLVKGANETSSLLSNADLWPKTDSFEHWMMAMESQMYMPDDILVKVDRAAMANSLETRVPMLDHRVIELAWSLPLSMKIHQGQGKWVLREVLYRHVPRELIERPKKGFAVPIADWLRGPLRDWAEALLSEKKMQDYGYFHSAPIRTAWQQHIQSNRDNSGKLWNVLMFQAWLDEQKN